MARRCGRIVMTAHRKMGAKGQAKQGMRAMRPSSATLARQSAVRAAMSGARLGLLAGVAATLFAACGAGNGGGFAAGESGGTGGSRPSGTAVRAVQLPNPGLAWLIFGADTVVAEVAGLPEQREKGLMDRDVVPDGTGMLFVFPRSEERSFWMRNTYVSLDIAFFDDGNRIAGIRQMEARDEMPTDSNIATKLVLEVRRGWFAEKGIKVGDIAEVVFGHGLTVR